MKTKLADFLNNIFKYIVVFLCIFLWVNYYYHNFLNSVIISLIITSIIALAFTRQSFYKQENYKKSKEEKSKIKNISTQLLFSSLADNINYFSKIFTMREIDHQVKSYGIILYPNKDERILFVPCYSFEDIIESVIVSNYKLCKTINSKRMILSGINFTQPTIQLSKSIKNFKIVLLNEAETYSNLIKNTDILPTKNIEFISSSKMTFAIFLNMLLDRKNTKSYFLSGILFMFASLFVSVGTYYLVFSTIMFVLSFFSFYGINIFKRNNEVIFKK